MRKNLEMRLHTLAETFQTLSDRQEAIGRRLKIITRPNDFTNTFLGIINAQEFDILSDEHDEIKNKMFEIGIEMQDIRIMLLECTTDGELCLRWLERYETTTQ